MSTIDIVDDQIESAQVHMEKDRVLLSQAHLLPRPLLRFYAWKQFSITYGHFIDPYSLVNKDRMGTFSCDMARRPTGGALLFHHYDFSFSILFPNHYEKLSTNVLENYALVNKAVCRAIGALHIVDTVTLSPISGQGNDNFCMAKPTQFDILYRGKKIGGAAQRRTKEGLLHQSSLFLFEPPWHTIETLLRAPLKNTVSDMQKASSSIMASEYNPQVYSEIHSELKRELLHQLQQ